MKQKIGFIGSGKMAQAIMKGILSSGTISAEQIMVSAKTEQTLKTVNNHFPIKTTMNNKEVACWSDFLFLAVKPDIHREVIQEIKDDIKDDAVIITIAAGITLQWLESEFDQQVKAVRSMPNTPSFVCEGMSALSVNSRVSNEEQDNVLAIFRSFGQAEIIQEELMDSIPAVSGSSPAYVFMFIEALADGGVKNGIPREQAYKFAAQAVLGAAKMVLETGLHPGELKDQVCTPGGVTIEAVSALEEHGFRAAVLKAMEQCTERIKTLKA